MNNRPLVLTAKAIGRKYDIDVVIAGDTACTNGKQITIPALSGPYAERLARGYLDHEAGHVRFSNFIFKVTNDFKGHLFNIIEDIWTERVMGEEYPGCRINLRELTRLLEEEGCFIADPNHPETSILAWIHSRARIDVLGHPMHKSLENAEGLTRIALGTRFAELQKCVAKIRDIVSTNEAVDLRDEIMLLLKEAQKDFDKEQKQMQKCDRGAQQTASPDGSQSSEENSNSCTADKKTGRGESKKSGKSSGQSTGNGNPGKEQQSGGAGTGTAGDPGMAESAKKALLNALDSTVPLTEGCGIGEILANKLSDEALKSAICGITGQVLPKGTRLKKGKPFDDLSELKTRTAKLRARLSGLVQSKRLKRSVPKSSGMRINRRVLPRLAVGDTRIFQHREEKRGINTAVVMLLDGSGSMTGRKIQLASQSCFITHEALTSLPGVKAATAMFRSEKTRVYELATFDEKPDPARFCVLNSGGTLLGHALSWGYAELMNRPEPRKICIAFSDGETSDGEIVHNVIKSMQTEGIEVLGIGILDTHILQYLPETHCKVISDLETLTPVLLELFENLLTQNTT